MNAKKIDATTARGKSIHSADPRKAAIVAALKAASGCRKVTTVKETKDGAFFGNCMNPNGAASVQGFWQVDLKAPPVPPPYECPHHRTGWCETCAST